MGRGAWWICTQIIRVMSSGIDRSYLYFCIVQNNVLADVKVYLQHVQQPKEVGVVALNFAYADNANPRNPHINVILPTTRRHHTET